jgi:hypothetical protein
MKRKKIAWRGNREKEGGTDGPLWGGKKEKPRSYQAELRGPENNINSSIGR